MMKKKFMLMINNIDEAPPEEESLEGSESKLSVEDPRALEKVILHLVTNLPSPKPEDISTLPDKGNTPTLPLAIIPPKKERIISAIDKINNVINIFTRDGLSPTKRQKNYYININSTHKPAEDETQNRADCKTDVSKCIEQKEVAHRQLNTRNKDTTKMSKESTDPAGRLYRFFVSRNWQMNPREAPTPVTTQSGVVYRPRPIYHWRQPMIYVPPPNEHAVSPMVEPRPGPSGIKRRSDEDISHEQSKIQKILNSDTQDCTTEDGVSTSTTTSTSWVGVRTTPVDPKTLVSLFLPIAVYPPATVTTVQAHVEPQPGLRLVAVQPLPQIVLQHTLQHSTAPLPIDNQLDATHETPDQALQDLLEIPDEILKEISNDEEPDVIVVEEENDPDDLMTTLSTGSWEAIDEAAARVAIRDLSTFDESEITYLLNLKKPEISL